MPAGDKNDAQEVHLTVQLEGRDPEVLAAVARAHGCRFLHVVLDSGVHPSQPMLSWRQAATVDNALQRAAELEQVLTVEGMKLVRTKIELMLEAAVEARYFEAHFKIELDEGALGQLQLLARELGVHVSRSAYARGSGKERRFLTARHGTRSLALAFFERVNSELLSRGFRVLDVDREAVVYDSNLALDDGWST